MLTRTAALAGALILTSLVLVAPPGQAVAPGVNGKLLVIADYDAHQDIFLMNPDGSGRVNLTGEDKSYVPRSPQGSPDGSRIVYTRSVSGVATDQVYVMNSDGTDKHAITTGEQGGGSSPTWSPDGTSIAFSRAGDIWTMDADGDNQAKVADAGSWALSAPEWSPDGQSIAYVQSDQAAGSRIVTQPAGGGAATFRTAYNDRARRPSWSPDGTKLLFWHDSGNVHGLYTMSPTGGGLALLRAMSSTDLGDYAWSPQGDRIVFVSGEGGNRDIWVMDADGTDVTQVTPTAADNYHEWASWASDAAPPTPLPAQTQGQPMTAQQLPFGGDGAATYAVIAGVLPPGLTLSASGQLTGTPTEWGSYVFTVNASDGDTTEKVKYSLQVLDPDAPEVSVNNPAPSTVSSHSVTSSLVQTVRWTGGDETSGVDTYDVRYRRASWDGGFGGFEEPSAWQGLDVRRLDHELPTGSTTCYSVRATDRSGVTGLWSPEKCTIAPLDDTSLQKSAGWKTKSSSRYFQGTAVNTTKKKARLTLSDARLTRVGVLATTCPTCGKVDVFVGGQKIGRISLARGSSMLHRKPLLLPPFPERSGTVRVKVVTKQRTVRIDGLIVGAR